MLQKPDLPDDQLVDRLQGEYGFRVADVTFLELGGDLGSAVYRVTAAAGSTYFCKLRQGTDDDIAAQVATFLGRSGVAEVIPPRRTVSGEPSTHLEGFSLSLYPFIEGVSGYDVELSPGQWAAFGAALLMIHTAVLPATLAARLSQEQFSAEWRRRCGRVLARVDGPRFDDPVSLEMQRFVRSKRDLVARAVRRADSLARVVASTSVELVLCHSDIHPGNLLISADGAVHIVDWDYPLRAPRERDLMFIGGGQGFLPYIAEQERELFYRAYGSVRLDPTLLTYYRYERGLTEVTVECERVLSRSSSQRERRQALEILHLYFLPGCTLEIAQTSDTATG